MAMCEFSAARWSNHPEFNEIRIRCLIEDDDVMDEVYRAYPEFVSSISEVVKIATESKPYSYSLMGPIRLSSTSMKSSVFMHWKKLPGMKDEDSGFSLFETIHPADEGGLVMAAMVMAQVVGQLTNPKFAQGNASTV